MKKDRIPTGISTLDQIVEGGFRIGDNILIAGQPGAGKTTLGLQFLHYGATKEGEKGVYATFVESASKLKRDAKSFGWNFQRLEEEGKVKCLDLIQTVGEKGVTSSFEIIHHTIKKMKASRLVIDSLTAMTTYIETKAEARSFIGILNRFLEQSKCTTLSLTEVPWGERKIGMGFEEFMGDGLIFLESTIDGVRVKRRLYIPKMRGVNHDLRCHDFYIRPDGIALSPMPATEVER